MKISAGTGIYPTYVGTNLKKQENGKVKVSPTKSRFDMYPLYWTLSKEGIFMRCSCEFKRKCVQLHRQGKWTRIEDARGTLALQHPAHSSSRNRCVQDSGYISLVSGVLLLLLIFGKTM